MTATAVLSLPPLLVIPMWLALPFGVAHVVYRRCGLATGLAAWTALMILMEFGLRKGPLAFPWPLLGNTQAEMPLIRSLAALGGVQLLSLLVVLANVVIVLSVHRSPRAAGVFGGFALIIVAAAILLDGRPAPKDVVRPPVRVAGIQPALVPAEWAELEDSSRVTLLLRLSRQVAADSSIDLIVWPETAIPPYPATRRHLKRVQLQVDSTGIPILAGAITTGGGRSAYRNSAVLSAPGTPVQTYDKINLVPFAEHVPFTHTLPFLERLAIPAGGVSGYEPGENRRIFEIPELRFGVLICFETLFGNASRAYARDGAEAIVAITQDGWWGDSFGYRQHLAFNRLRSIETGVPVIQVAVTGISALIYPDGRVHEIAGWMERSVWSVDLPPPVRRPAFVRLGDWVSLLAAIASMVLLALYTLRKRRLYRSEPSRHAS